MVSPSPEMKIFSVLVKASRKTEIELFRQSAISHIKARVCLKYLVNDCKYALRSNTLAELWTFMLSKFPRHFEKFKLEVGFNSGSTSVSAHNIVDRSKKHFM